MTSQSASADPLAEARYRRLLTIAEDLTAVAEERGISPLIVAAEVIATYAGAASIGMLRRGGG